MQSSSPSDTGAAARNLHLALQALQRGDGSGAETAATEALEGFTTGGDRTGAAAAHQVLAMIALLGGTFDAALAHVDAALPLRGSTGDREGVASLWQERLEICLRMGDLGGALDAARKQVAALAGAGDAEARAHAAHQLAQMLLQTGDDAGAAQVLQDALFAVSGTSGMERARSALLLQLASVWMQRQQPDQALGRAREALDLARQARHRPAEIDAIQHIGVILAGKGDLFPAQRALTEALAGREQLKDADGKASVLRELGAVEAKLGDVDTGLARFIAAADALLEAGNAPGAVACHQLRIALADESERPEAALESARALVRLAAELGDAEASAAAQFLVATRLAGLGDLTGAELAFRASLAAQEAQGLAHEAAVCRGMLGQVVYVMGRVDEGRALLGASHDALVALGSSAADTVHDILHELDAASAAEGT